LRLNGHRRVTVKTLHGSFELLQQMYQASGESIGFLTLSGKSGFGYVSRGLQELVTYYSNRLGYEESSGLVARLTGSAQLSAQSIWNIVQDTAQALSDQQATEDAGWDFGSAAPIAVDGRDDLDIYDGQATEILLMEDGILVKAQKASRAKGGSPDEAIVGAGRRPRTNVVNDVMVLEIRPGEFEYLFPPITRAGEFRIPLESMLLQRLQHHYASWTKPLPIVVISDGAKVIRQRLQRVFGDGVWIILDWYHLDRKIYQLMSMIGRSKEEKATHAASILGFLWEGRTVEAIDYLRNQVAVRNIDKHQELIGYLEKHQGEIIDYKRRQATGKTIGSGRMEKAVDQVIGHRQKRKGMSWRPEGSRALALLKVLELNGGWQDFWFPSTTA
jgi:Uncharacterised protein family (UPF0236)